MSRQIQLSFTRADCLSNEQIRCSTALFAVNISFFTCMLACTNTDTARKTAADDWDYIPSHKWPLYLSHTTYTQELDKWYFYFPSQLSQHLFSPIYKVDAKYEETWRLLRIQLSLFGTKGYVWPCIEAFNWRKLPTYTSKIIKISLTWVCLTRTTIARQAMYVWT